MSPPSATPSDLDPDVLAAGRTDVTTLFVAMAGRDPEGRDADYLAWHALDHRPEIHRLAALRGAQRLVSTPACRGARLVSDARYEITYCYLDDDPVAVADRLRPAVERRWAGGGVVPLLAAPFHVPVDLDWGRHLP